MAPSSLPHRDPPIDTPALLISGFGDAVSGGGLFALDGSSARCIDRIATMGLRFDGRRLLRVLRCVPEAARVCELVVYDERGVQRYLRLDDAQAVHDAAWDGDDMVVASTWDNAVRWFSPGGDRVREVRLPGPTDSWHLNCITRHEGVWYATVFGAFRTFRAWVPLARSREGRIIELETGRVVVAGLTGPHTPRFVDGLWLVCNSDQSELRAVDAASGAVVRRVACDGWTRGLAHDDAFLYVGVCRRRATAESVGHASVVVIDRQTWKTVEEVTVPVQEIFDLEFVSRAVLAGAERGFDVNPQRAAEARQLARLYELGSTEPRSLWPSGDPLPWSEFRCAIEAAIPATVDAGALFEVPVRVANRSASFFTSAAPAPVYVSYKWLNPQTGAYLDERRAYRTWLPRTIFPNDSVDLRARIIVPLVVGAARLRITLVQEGVSWFDERDVACAVEAPVEITPALPPPDDDSPIVS